MRINQVYILISILLCSLSHGQTNSKILYNSNNGLVPDDVYFCAGDVFNLKVNATATSTGDYTVLKDLPQNFPLSAAATPIVFSTTGSNPNKFSKPIDIGFGFSFYGTTYNQVVAGTNGRLVFTNNAELTSLYDSTTYQDRTYTGSTSSSGYSILASTDYNKVYLSDNTKTLPLAQIFFGYTDLYYSSNSSTTYSYKYTSVGGLSALLISYQQEIHYDSTSGLSANPFESSVLLISDGRIVVFVNSKTETSYNAILGIQNETATKFKVPTSSISSYNYNNGKWATEGVAWVFKPSQNLTPKVDWYLDGNLTLSNNNNFSNYAPLDNVGTGEKLEAKISFFDDTNTQVGSTETSSVLFHKLTKPQISDPNYTSGCGNPAEIHVINPNPKLTYDWYSQTDPTFRQTGTSINVGNGTYFVRIKNTAGTCQVDSDPKVVNITSILPPFTYEGQTIKICDNLKQSSINVDLSNYYAQGSNYTVEFYEGGSTIALPGNMATINSGQSKDFIIKVYTNTGISPTCTFSKKFSVSYLSFPPNGQPYSANTLCAGVTAYSTADFKAEFFPNTTYDVKFSTDGVNFTLDSVNPSAQASVFVKLSNANFTCTSTGTINFSFYPAVTANAPNPNDPSLQQCASSTQTYDLHALFDSQVNSGNVKITYHTTLQGAQNGDNSVPDANAFRSNSLGSVTLYIRVVDNVTGCVAKNFPTVTLVVYKKPKIISGNPIVLQSCPGSQFNLTQNPSNLTDAQSPIIVKIDYYAENGTLLTAAQISNYDPTALGFKPYIILTYNSTCGDKVLFDLQYFTKPVVKISQIPICGQTSYPLSDFLNAIIDNPSNYSFTDENGNALPNSFDVSFLPKSVNVIITDKTSGCKSDVQAITFFAGSEYYSNLNLSLTQCDTDFDGVVTFNLDDFKSQISIPANTVVEYYSDSAYSQKISNSYQNKTAFSDVVYVLIAPPGYCPTKSQIKLTVNTPTKSSTLQPIYYICYGDKLSVDAGLENVSFQWSDGQTSQVGIFSSAGNYSVKLTNSNGCSYTQSFEISTKNQPIIELIDQSNEQIVVVASGGISPYQYSFDGGITWQDSNKLLNPSQDSYTIQVRSANGCLGPPKSIYTIVVFNVITPNGDGVNDTWSIKNLDKMQDIEVAISDRYGKSVFYSTDSNKLIWDGKLNGEVLPSSSYWYGVKWFDPSTNKAEFRQGWIFLKNRN